MRVGEVVKIVLDRKFGFIRADNFRNDIFFHFSKVVGSNPEQWFIGQEVEFELNEVRRLEIGELEAEKVQVASRPLVKTLQDHRTPGLKALHHPKARRRRPVWRLKAKVDEPNPNATPSDTPVHTDPPSAIERPEDS